MNREDIITVGNGKQKRTMKWSEFCSKWLRNNGGTIKAMEAEMDTNGEATWFDGNDELEIKKGDTI